MRAPEGVLVVDKPAGPTSHDIVEAARRYTAGLRVGHTGTLDPFATGVLALCIGRATRLSRFLTASRKTYDGVIQLGTVTDTYDLLGRTMAELPVPALAIDEVRQAASRLTGTMMQTPPPYSARKVRGRPMHRWAREGRVVEARPTPVTVHRFDIVEMTGSRARFEMETTSGTYVRSLAHDLGAALGCGACLAQLRRVANGSIRIADAHTMEEVERRGHDGTLREIVIPLERIDLGLPSVTTTSEGLAAMKRGRPLGSRDYASASPSTDGPVRVEDLEGNLLGIAVPAHDARGDAVLRPHIVLVS